MLKRIMKLLLVALLVVVLGVCGLFAWLSVAEYRPRDIEDAAPVSQAQMPALKAGATLNLLSWNIGYAGLGRESDFFMDGGKHTQSADRPTVERYLAGIKATIRDAGCDFTLLQEVDRDSARSYGIDEAAELASNDAWFAPNYVCPFVPYPLPPIGRVKSGLMTLSAYDTASSERIALPCPFSWPIRTANLKRCLLVTRVPIEGSDRQLVLVNLHLEAYDNGEGKVQQTRQLRELILAEYQRGNYVIAGGDFNQVFPGSMERYPNTHEALWRVGALDESQLPEGWRFAYSLESPTCRLLNQPYDPSDAENTQHYVIDGFILSPNVRLDEVENLAGEGFTNSDHNPVRLRVTLE